MMSVERRLHEENVRSALRTYEKHRIKHLTETAVLIAIQREDGSWCSDYITEIVSGGLGYLILTGDCDTVVFARGTGSLKARLQWVAGNQHDPSIAYLAGKASLGLDDDRKLVQRFNPELISDFAEALVSSLSDDEESDSKLANDIEAVCRDYAPYDESDIDTLVSELECVGVHDVSEHLDYLYMVDRRVYLAWAACVRALELMEAGEQRG